MLSAYCMAKRLTLHGSNHFFIGASVCGLLKLSLWSLMHVASGKAASARSVFNHIPLAYR